MKNMLDKLAKSKNDDHQDHADAKMKVLHELREMAMEMMGEKVRGKLPGEMHGVEVMAPDQEGLAEGLDLARKVVPGADGQPDRSHALDNDADVSPDRLENPGEDHDDMSDDELDAMIAELEAKKSSRHPRV